MSVISLIAASICGIVISANILFAVFGNRLAGVMLSKSTDEVEFEKKWTALCITNWLGSVIILMSCAVLFGSAI